MSQDRKVTWVNNFEKNSFAAMQARKIGPQTIVIKYKKHEDKSSFI